MTIDLDKLREARLREAAKEAPTFVYNGETYQLPVELSFRQLLMLDQLRSDAEVPGVLASLLGEDRAEHLLDSGIAAPELLSLFGAILGEYGLSPEKADASAGS